MNGHNIIGIKTMKTNEVQLGKVHIQCCQQHFWNKNCSQLSTFPCMFVSKHVMMLQMPLCMI